MPNQSGRIAKANYSGAIAYGRRGASHRRHRATSLSGSGLVLGFGGLRFGEATALRRRDVQDEGGSLRVERNARYVDKEWLVGPPKTDAGRRTVALPEFVATAGAAHLQSVVPDDPDALVFGTAPGTFVARQNFGAT